MPALQADWPLIQQLYVQGIKPKAIAEQTGVKADTISARASRYAWKKLTQETKQILQAVNANVAIVQEEHSDDSDQIIQKASSRVRNSLAATLEKLADKLDAHEPKSLKQAIRLQGDLEPAVRNAKTVCGWNDSSAEPTVRISLMSTARLRDPSSASDAMEGRQVIDVQATKQACLLPATEPQSEAGPPFDGSDFVI